MQRIYEKIKHLTNELQIVRELCEQHPHLLDFHVHDIELLEKAIEDYKILAEGEEEK